MRDRGSIGIMVVILTMMLMTATLLAMGATVDTMVDQQRARTAADAAALAGVIGGRTAAEQVASRNGGVIDSYVVDGQQVTVTVRVGDRLVTARATDEP